jgi:hypothetical protein
MALPQVADSGSGTGGRRGRPECNDGQLSDEPLARSVGAVVSPTDEPAQNPVEDRSQPPVALLVTGQDFGGFVRVQLTMGRPEALLADGHFERLMRLKIAIPLRRPAEPGDYHQLASPSILSDHLEHCPTSSSGLAPHMREQQEPTAKDPAGVPVIDTRRSAKHTTHDRPRPSVSHDVPARAAT